MAIAGPSTGADVSEPENARLRAGAARSFAPAFLTVCAVLCTMLVAGCARNPPQREVKPARQDVKVVYVRAAPRVVRYCEPSAKPLIRRPDPALLAAQPAPDCEFNRSDLRTVDPNKWALLKIEYERQCYKDAEKAARDRLSALQASSTCEIEPARRPKTQQSTPR